MKFEWDIFICHASEDKEDFVRPLAEELISKNLRVWYDEFSLELGNSLRQSIDNGLAKSRYGIVVLSPSFFKKDWPQKELNGLVSRERNGIKVILPIWHKIGIDNIIKFSPILADRVAAKSSEGVEKVVEQILKTIENKNKSTFIDHSEYNLSNLTKEQQELLISALNSNGWLYIIETDQTGKFVQIGDRDFIENADPEVRVSYLEALDSLIKYGLVSKENLRSYSLTKAGFKLAKSQKINSLMEKAWDLYNRKGLYLKSIEVYQEIITKYQFSGEAKEAQKMIGINFWHLSDYKKAEEALKKAIDMGNRFSSTYFYYGDALLKNEKFQEAKDAFEISMSLPDIPDWVKQNGPEKINLCIEKNIAELIPLADKKFDIEKEKINYELKSNENDMREKLDLIGLRNSSVLAKNILDINIEGIRKKLEKKLEIDKDIIYTGRLINTEEDVNFLYKRLEKLADYEKDLLKIKIKEIYQKCYPTNVVIIENEIDRLLQEILISLEVIKKKN